MVEKVKHTWSVFQVECVCNSAANFDMTIIFQPQLGFGSAFGILTDCFKWFLVDREADFGTKRFGIGSDCRMHQNTPQKIT